MAAFLDLCRFLATAGGTTDWTYSSTVTPYISPSTAGAVNGRIYKVRAESADLTQWEVSEGAYSSAGAGSFARTTVLYNSSGTGTLQSGAGTKINFTVAPQVWVVASKRDLLSIEEANSFTTTQKQQAQSNIGVRKVLAASTTLYVGAVVGAPTISIASPGVCTLNSHGLSNDDRVVLSVLEDRRSCTISAANPGVCTMTQSFAAGQPIQFWSTGNLPANVAQGTTYYVISTGLSGSSFQFSATPGGAAINTTALTNTFTNGSSTIQFSANHNLVVGQIIQFSGTSVVNFSNATNYYVRSVPAANQVTVSATNDGTAITAGVVTTQGTLVQCGSHIGVCAGALPTGITEGTVYYVANATTNTFTLSTTPANANPVNTSGSVTGSPVYSCWTGNDNNDGSAATRAGALLTMQKAIDTVAGWDIVTNNVTIQLCDGVHNDRATVNAPWVGSGVVTLNGNSTFVTNASCTADAFGAILVQNFGVLTISNLRVTSLSANSYNLVAVNYGILNFGAGVDLGKTGTGAALALSGGVINLTSFTCSGPDTGITNSVLLPIQLGTIGGNVMTINIYGIRNYAQAWAKAGNVAFGNVINTTINGSATGKRYNVTGNAVLQTAAGANFFPGNIAGTTSTGGQYV